MTTSETRDLASRAWTDDDYLWLQLTDGRQLAVPLAYYPRLLHATAEQRARVEMSGGGSGLHWPDVDEELSVEGLLHGIPDQTRLGREHRASCELCKSAKRKAARPTPRKQRASA